MTQIANVYIPAFTWPYLAPWVVPVLGFLIVLIEFGFIWVRHPGKCGPWTFATSLIANGISSAVGFLIALPFPHGYVSQPAAGHPQVSLWEVGPSYRFWALLSLLLAFGLSIGLEFLVWRTTHRRISPRSLLRTLTLAHLATYGLLGGLLLLD